MAMTHDYLDYLNQKVGIAPANSQEELQAAQTISWLMGQHEVEPSIEEFDAPLLGGLSAAILGIVMFLGVLVSGFGVVALTVVGFILAIIPAVLVVMRLFGREPSLTVGPQARSQNVIAVHRATGPLVSKGNRPIVVVAHYDTPHENFLYSTPVAPYLPLVTKLTEPCCLLVAVCALIQVMGFLPAPARIVFWIIGIIASLPALLLAVAAIYERFSPCTLGANDNKSGVAAMLGVLENVRPSGLVPTPRESETRRKEAAEGIEEPFDAEGGSEPEPVSAAVAVERVEVLGVRHGEDVLRSLAILPEECEIEYRDAVVGPAPAGAEEPAGASQLAAEEAGEPRDAVENGPEPDSELEQTRLFPFVPASDEEVAPSKDGATDAATPADEADDSVVSAPAAEPSDEDAAAEAAPSVSPESTSSLTLVTDEAEATMPSRPVASAPAESDLGATREDLLSDGRFSLVMDGEGSRGVGKKDASGLDTTEGTFALDETQPVTPDEKPHPTAPADPEWGKTSYRPQVSPMARRASLFDLPDPSSVSSDPFNTNPSAQRINASAPTSAPSAGVQAPEPIETISTSEAADEPEAKENPLAGLLDRVKGFFSKLGGSSVADDAESSADQAEETSADDGASPSKKGEATEKTAKKATGKGGWLGDSEDDPLWRGGATSRDGLRLVGDEDAPTEEELREAVLGLGDDALVSHDIWFVALGGSSLDHAGMRSFLRSHRSEVRGCFIVNLDRIGAGELTVLTKEGLESTRRADRRLVRLLSGAAKDLHHELAQQDYDWMSTDATPAMRSSMRSVTVMGLGENGLPALSRTPDDVAENVSGDQAAAVTEIVTEMIRRS